MEHPLTMKARLELFLTPDDPSFEYLRHAFNRLANFQNRDDATPEMDKAKSRLLSDNGASFHPEDVLLVSQMLMNRAKFCRAYVHTMDPSSDRRGDLLAAAENGAMASLQLSEWWAQVGPPVARAQAACQRVELPPPSTDPR